MQGGFASKALFTARLAGSPTCATRYGVAQRSRRVSRCDRPVGLVAAQRPMGLQSSQRCVWSTMEKPRCPHAGASEHDAWRGQCGWHCALEREGTRELEPTSVFILFTPFQKYETQISYIELENIQERKL
jgi:hypothetical protein